MSRKPRKKRNAPRSAAKRRQASRPGVNPTAPVAPVAVPVAPASPPDAPNAPQSTPSHPPVYTDEVIGQVLKKTMGSVYLAAEALKCSHTTIYRRLEVCPALREIVDASKGKIGDVAVTALYQGVLAREPWAVARVLDSAAFKDRGFGKHSEQNLTGNLAIPQPGLIEAVRQEMLEHRARRANTKPDSTNEAPARDDGTLRRVGGAGFLQGEHPAAVRGTRLRLMRFHGTPVRLPQRSTYAPAAGFLEWHLREGTAELNRRWENFPTAYSDGLEIPAVARRQWKCRRLGWTTIGGSQPDKVMSG